MTTQIRRRSVVKGAAWSIPSVSIAASAPAFAASGATASASSCLDFSNNCAGGSYRGHLSGRTANNANLYLYHGFTAGSSPIPSGTVFTWTDTFYVRTSDVSTQLSVQPSPISQADSYGTWAASKISQGASTSLNGTSYTAMNYTVTYTLNREVPANGSICSYVVTSPAFIRRNIAYPGISISGMTMSAGTVSESGAYTSGTISTSAGTDATSASCL